MTRGTQMAPGPLPEPAGAVRDRPASGAQVTAGPAGLRDSRFLTVAEVAGIMRIQKATSQASPSLPG